MQLLALVTSVIPMLDGTYTSSMILKDKKRSSGMRKGNVIVGEKAPKIAINTFGPPEWKTGEYVCFLVKTRISGDLMYKEQMPMEVVRK